MRILAIDTSTAIGSVALLDEATPFAQVSEAVPQRHLEWLAPAIQRLLAGAGRQPGHVEAVAVATGPGSFTSLRIGIATALVWARAQNIPIVGVPTLEAMAMSVEASGLVCPMLDARRGEVSAALFQRDGTLTRVMDVMLASMDVLLKRLPTGSPIIFMGDALVRYASSVQAQRPDAVLISPEGQSPLAVAVGRLAWERLSAGERDDPYSLRPIYVRPPTDKEKYGIGG